MKDDDIHQCDLCPCVATCTLFLDGEVVGHRCNECFETLRRKVHAGTLGDVTIEDDDDDPLRGIDFTWFGRGHAGEA